LLISWVKEIHMTQNKTAAVLGAFAGASLFIVFALVPALVYGGYAGLLLAGGIFGNPVPALLAARALVGFGMLLGVVATGSVFTVAGAVLGTVISSLLGVKPFQCISGP
jgi:hypothetical protein